MANVRKGNLTAPQEWWRHLKWLKPKFWRKERRAHQREIRRQLADGGR